MMMDAGLLNFGSLILGVVAWIIPVVAVLGAKQKDKRWLALSISSFSACAIAVCLQIFYTYHLVMIQDWTALMDTVGTMALVSGVLVSVTILLNALALFFRNRKPTTLSDMRIQSQLTEH